MCDSNPAPDHVQPVPRGWVVGFQWAAPPSFSRIDNDAELLPLHPGALAVCNWPSLTFSGRLPSATPENSILEVPLVALQPSRTLIKAFVYVKFTHETPAVNNLRERRRVAEALSSGLIESRATAGHQSAANETRRRVLTRRRVKQAMIFFAHPISLTSSLSGFFLQYYD